MLSIRIFFSIMRPAVAVLDANNRVAYSILRGLHIAGIQADMVGEGISSLSRYGRKFRDRDLSGYDVILPAAINTLLRLSMLPGIAGRKMPFPAYEILKRVNNKFELARAAGVLAPETQIAGTVSEAVSVFKSMSGRVVFKMEDDEGTYLIPADRYEIVADQSSVNAAAEKILSTGKRIVIQEYVEGYGAGASVFLWHGKVVASFCHRRVRELPAGGGPSSVAVPLRNDELVSMATKVMRDFGYEGLAMAEFRIDRSGRPFLIEINPRFWGTVGLAIACGINFPEIVVNVLTGREVRRNHSMNDATFTNILADPAAAAYLLTFSKVFDAMVDFSDPMPFMLAAPMRIWDRLRKK